MRHNVYGKHLGRNKNERTALFRNLVQSLVIHENIQTTEPKAKAIKGLVDTLINKAKKPSTQITVKQFFNQKTTLDKIINDIAPRYPDRPSGFTSIVRLGKRMGDGAMIVKMSLVEGSKKVAAPKALKAEKSAKTEKLEAVSEKLDKKGSK